MRIFRQHAQGDWSAPVAAIAAALHRPPAIPAVLTLAAADLAGYRLADAETRLRQAMRDHPHDPELPAVHAALAQYLLLTERWAEAWPEWAISQPRQVWPTPVWDGCAMAGETLLLHASNSEDVLLFGRYVPAAARRSEARVVLSVPPELQRLMAGWPDVTVATAEQPSHHRHLPFALLPVLFRARTNNIPETELCPPPPLPVIEAWSRGVTRLRGLRVGVAFNDAALLNAIGRIPGVNLVALREGLPRTDPTVVVRDWVAGFNDLAAAAGLITHLDLIITGDNIIAHLAGALGPGVAAQPGATEVALDSWPRRQFLVPNVTAISVNAAAAIATALGRADRRDSGERIFSYANECHRRRDYRAAATGFRQVLALDPGHAGALGNLAITMLSLGRPGNRGPSRRGRDPRGARLSPAPRASRPGTARVRPI